MLHLDSPVHRHWWLVGEGGRELGPGRHGKRVGQGVEGEEDEEDEEEDEVALVIEEEADHWHLPHLPLFYESRHVYDPGLSTKVERCARNFPFQQK